MHINFARFLSSLFLILYPYLCCVKKPIFIISFILFCVLQIKSQSTLDTIKNCLKQKPRPFAKLDSRNSFIDNNLVNIFGVKAGISYGKRLGFGIGYNQLYKPPKNLNEDAEYLNALGKPYIISKGLKLYYISATVDYVFYQTKYWELSIPLQIGIGETYYQYELNNVKIKVDKNINFIYEPTVSVNYKIIKWIGVGFDFGYRFMIANSRKLNQQFNAPIVTFDVIIYHSEIFKSLFPHSKLAKKL